MRDEKCPECRWVSVVDASGRRHMEMRWNAAERVGRQEQRAA
ncbi:hypothetical protein ACI79I_15435 [Geodermatophilus sp. SYSU D01105]